MQPELLSAPAPWWGVFDPADWQLSLNAIKTNPVYANIDKLTGSPMASTHPQLSWANGLNADGSPKYQRLYTPRLDADRAAGRLSCMTWMSWNLGDPNALTNGVFSNEAILAGKHDAYINQLAQDAAAYKHTFIVRLNPEMNGWWEGPFAEYDSNGNIAYGNQPGDFVKAWRYIVQRVRAVAPNVLWYWCANPVGNRNVPNPGAASLGGAPTSPNQLVKFYPGDDVVDFVGADFYNWAASRNMAWMYIADCLEGGKGGYGNTWATIRSFTNKPWIIGEFATHDVATAGDTTPGVGDVAHWFADFFATLPARYPQIVGALYYNWGDASYHWTITPTYATAIGQGLKANGWLQAGGFPLPPDGTPLASYAAVVTPDKDAAYATVQQQLRAAQTSLTALQQQLQAAQAVDAADQTQIGSLQQQLLTATHNAQAAEAAMKAAQQNIQQLLSFSSAPVP